MVEEQGFKLEEDFALLNNKSDFAIGDYHHTFTLKISSRDRAEAIRKINESNGFTSEVESFYFPYTHDRYFGRKVTWNYENEYSYVRAYFEPAGRKGYAPTYRQIHISKTEDELTFYDINE